MINQIFLTFTKIYKEYARLLILVLICFLLIVVLFYTKIIPNLNRLTPKTPPILTTEVDTITIGSSDVYTKVIGICQNENQITIKALTKGIVNKIKVDLGEEIKENDEILILTQNYTNQDFFDEEIKIAKTELEKAKQELSYLKDISKIEEEIASQITENFEETVDIRLSSINNLKQQLDILTQIIQDLDIHLDNLSSIEDKAQIVSLQNEIQEIISKLKLLEYQTSSRNPDLEILENKEELVQNQYRFKISIAEYNVDIYKAKLELLELQRQMRTSISPIDGTVEKIFVKESDSVEINDELFIINGEVDMTIKILISPSLASTIDLSKEALIDYSSDTYTAQILHISQVPTQENLFEVTLKPEDGFQEFFVIGQSIEVKVPLRYKSTTDNKLYIPVDSVHIRNNQFYVYIIEDDHAVLKPVKTGNIIANQIEILDGLIGQEVLILDRNVVSEQKVQPRQTVLLIDEVIDDQDQEPEEEDNDEDI